MEWRMSSNVISDHIMRRAGGICKEISSVFPPQDAEFYMAGGCLTGRVSDVDLFPGSTDVPEPTVRCISHTRNAATYDHAAYPIQVCSYRHKSLQSLVDSFDFAHIQVGAKVVAKGGRLRATECYYTEAFVQSRAVGVSWFTGSEYPLSSLIRGAKYFKRGDMPRGSYIRAVIDTLSAVVTRGFDGYEDFKNQLDAVDLGLLPEELEDVGNSGLLDLFSALDRSGG